MSTAQQKTTAGGFEQAGVVGGKWDNGTVAAWDNRQWDNGPLIIETMYIGTVDTEQLPDACVIVWQT